MKKISAGLILTDGISILLCHSTGHNFHDIPKGEMTAGESAIDTCIREVKEETNIDVQKDQLVDLGEFLYTKTKDLHLFIYKTDNLPDTKNMSCSSYFRKLEEYFPEVDSFEYIKFTDKSNYVTENLNNVLTKITL